MDTSANRQRSNREIVKWKHKATFKKKNFLKIVIFIYYSLLFNLIYKIVQDANAVMQESIGDAIFLGLMTPQHLNRLQLLPDKYLFANKLPKLDQTYLKMVHSHKSDQENKEFMNFLTNVEKIKASEDAYSNYVSDLTVLGVPFPRVSDLNERMSKYQAYKTKIDQSINVLTCPCYFEWHSQKFHKYHLNIFWTYSVGMCLMKPFQCRMRINSFGNLLLINKVFIHLIGKIGKIILMQAPSTMSLITHRILGTYN